MTDLEWVLGGYRAGAELPWAEYRANMLARVHVALRMVALCAARVRWQTEAAEHLAQAHDDARRALRAGPRHVRPDMADAEEAIACERARYQAMADACETMVMLSEWLDMAEAAAREFAALPAEQP